MPGFAAFGCRDWANSRTQRPRSYPCSFAEPHLHNQGKRHKTANRGRPAGYGSSTYWERGLVANSVLAVKAKETTSTLPLLANRLRRGGATNTWAHLPAAYAVGSPMAFRRSLTLPA